MGERSKIEWTDATWNPVTGCTKISPGCKNCYAERMALRLKAMGQPRYANGFAVATHADALTVPLRWKKPRRIFVNSMSDLFHEDVPLWFVVAVFAVMEATPRHIYQILTKRASRMARITLSPQFPALTRKYGIDRLISKGYMSRGPHWHSNVILGASIEDQQRADERMGPLCELGEADWHTMVSAEPLLGSVVLPERYLALGKRAWCIAGGESGPKARPSHPGHFRSLRDQCQAAAVPYFLKQMDVGGKIVKLPLLDGRVWDEVPEVLR